MGIVNTGQRQLLSVLLLENCQKKRQKKQEKARKSKKSTASRKQNQITEDTLFCAGWIVVITSLGIEYCGEEILHLYRSRWQVELLFKRFKQNFFITTLKAGSTNYAETEVLLWLIIWVISERQSFLAECFLVEKGETENYSVYEKCKVAFLQIKEILCLSWSQFMDITDKNYSRDLSKRKRYREDQNDEFHTAILP
ncbi:MAG: transposase [Lachnospiraceae bacterium]|nr:transposase [Lachnospiraceae bacterium]